jgi:hypothetical protein
MPVATAQYAGILPKITYKLCPQCGAEAFVEHGTTITCINNHIWTHPDMSAFECCDPVTVSVGLVTPVGDPGFHAILREMGRLYDKKQADYGTAEDPFANYRSSEDIGIPAWKNAFLRTTEKVNRVKSFIRNGKLANESIEDAFMDIAVTAMISLLTYRQNLAKENPL